jgi:hypothetical protein
MVGAPVGEGRMIDIVRVHVCVQTQQGSRSQCRSYVKSAQVLWASHCDREHLCCW